MRPLVKLIPALCIPVILLTACDPGHVGKTFVQNDTPYTLRLSYTLHNNDSTVLEIAPNTNLSVHDFGGLGAGNKYTCCPCEFTSLSLQPTDSGKTLGKSINNTDQWELSNPNKSPLNHKEIRCTFTVTEADIQ